MLMAASVGRSQSQRQSQTALNFGRISAASPRFRAETLLSRCTSAVSARKPVHRWARRKSELGDCGISSIRVPVASSIALASITETRLVPASPSALSPRGLERRGVLGEVPSAGGDLTGRSTMLGAGDGRDVAPSLD